MSKERETLITDLSINAVDGFFYITQELQSEIRELLAQPEQKREPLSYEHLEDLVDRHHGYPMTLGRAIEKAHGITGVDDEC